MDPILDSRGNKFDYKKKEFIALISSEHHNKNYINEVIEKWTVDFIKMFDIKDVVNYI